MKEAHEHIKAVQKRPGMYVGPTDDGTGLHNLVYEVVGNAVNEALRGYATHVVVKLNDDGSCTVSDDGRGLSTEIHPRFGQPLAELYLTTLNNAGHTDDYLHKGLRGTGLCPVNALSAWLELRTQGENGGHRFRYRNGMRDSPIETLTDSSMPRGTEVTFLPSTTVFNDIRFDRGRLAQRFKELTAQYQVPIEFEGEG